MDTLADTPPLSSTLLPSILATHLAELKCLPVRLLSQMRKCATYAATTALKMGFNCTSLILKHHRITSRKFIKIKTVNNDRNVLIEHHVHDHYHHNCCCHRHHHQHNNSNNNVDKEGIKPLILKISFIHWTLRSTPLWNCQITFQLKNEYTTPYGDSSPLCFIQTLY